LHSPTWNSEVRKEGLSDGDEEENIEGVKEGTDERREDD